MTEFREQPGVYTSGAVATSLDASRQKLATHPRQLSIHLVNDACSVACPFWIGVAAGGNQSARELLDQPTTATMLMAAATKGLSEPTPLMLTDTTYAPLRSVLVMPIPAADVQSRALWVQELIIALKPWNAVSIGFYLAPEALPLSTGFELLLGALQGLLHKGSLTSLYLLTGQHGINPVLNAALELKHELQNADLNLYVYH